jgi:hypothetical protein
LISRADMAARGPAGYRQRLVPQPDLTWHLEKAGRIGRTNHWREDEWTPWREGRLRGKVESLTRVDRSGDPDDLVDAARALGYANRYVIHANRRLGYFPEPDSYGKAARSRRCDGVFDDHEGRPFRE